MAGPVAGILALAVLVVLIVIIQVIVLATRYRKVGPNQALIISGRGSIVRRPDGTREKVGYRIVTGGGTFVWPIVEQVEVLSLESFNVKVSVSDAVTDSGGLVDIEGVAQIKVGGDFESIRAAAERFLSKTREEMADAFSEVVGGHARTVARRMTADEIERDRDTFAHTVREAAAPEIAEMGLSIDSFTLPEVRVRRRGE